MLEIFQNRFYNLLNNLNITYKRYLFNKIDFSEKLIGIIGARGVGKTTFSTLTAYRLAFSYYNPYELRILVWTTEHRPFSLKRKIRQNNRFHLALF